MQIVKSIKNISEYQKVKVLLGVHINPNIEPFPTKFVSCKLSPVSGQHKKILCHVILVAYEKFVRDFVMQILRHNFCCAWFKHGRAFRLCVA